MRYSLLIGIFFVLQFRNSLVFSRRTKVQDSDESNLEQESIWQIFGPVSRAKENIPLKGRRHDTDDAQVRYFYKTLSKTVDVEDFKDWLRHESTVQEGEGRHRNPRDELASLVEKELLRTLDKRSSATLSKPFVQKKGRNDFLVIQSDPSDPFVTVVPNDIYYNVEKKCVNWLDDCNQKGLRGRLLQKVHGPYK